MSDDFDAAEDELGRLRAQVAALETQLLEVEARANRAVVDAQEKTYWLDRWRIDLNEVMERDAIRHTREAARQAWAACRALTRVTRRPT
jgi:hypothetical protein